jgi:two-component system LytT family response regulator
MKPLTCVIVDDEALARRQLRALLEGRKDIAVVGEAGGVAAAVEMAGRLRPDLLFLDIQMRGREGFEVLEALDDPPEVIFVTAHDEHAIRAFEVNAVGYLLKPVDEARLDLAITRVRQVRESRHARLGEEGAALLPLGVSGQFVAAGDILFVEADGHHCKVGIALAPARMIREPFRTWSERLPEGMFIRLDRGLIVNRRRIRSFDQGPNPSLSLDGMSEPLTLGATAARRLGEILSS